MMDVVKNEFMDSETFVSPSDIGQSYVRLFVISAIVLWSLFNEMPLSYSQFIADPLLLSFPCYLLYSVVFLLLSYWIEGSKYQRSRVNHAKRISGLFIDLVSCALYIHLAGSYALAIYPIYVTIIVGYGLRYGVHYLTLAIAVALTSFTVLAIYNPLFQQSQSLMIGFYLGLILIPGYAAILLKKYQDLLRRLSETNAARARFIANMSHELRTPLHAIIGNAEVLGTRLSELERREPEFAQLSSSAKMVSEASEHLRTLVDGVLDIASNDAGTFVLGEARNADLYRIVRSAIAIAAPGTRKPGVAIHWHIDPRVPRIVETWEQHLKAVLINTIGNAVKYTEMGTITVGVGADPHPVDSSFSIVKFSIADTGIGIPEDRLETIFEPFSIGDDSRARRFEGTGLGLAITKQYLDEMRGRIEVSSTEGTGTHVSIQLPMKATAEDCKPSMRTASALLVTPNGEDHGLTDWLKNNDFHCLVAGWNGEQLVGVSTTARPDVVFVACDRPEDAETIARGAAAIYPEAMAILLSASPIELANLSLVTRVAPYDDDLLSNVHSLLDQTVPNDRVSRVSRRRVLMVDDNQMNLQSAQIALKNYGHTVETANNGREALAVLNERNFDIVFMDMHMPDMSGIEACTIYARESAAPAPVVILTADATKSASSDADIPDVAGFLTKPIRPSELQHAIERFAIDSAREQSSQCREEVPRIAPIPSAAFSSESYIELLDSGTEPVTLESLIARFTDDACAIIEESRNAGMAGDTETLGRLLHKLKGSAAAMHIHGLVTTIESFERSERQSACAHAVEHAHELRESVVEAAAEVRQFIRENAGRKSA